MYPLWGNVAALAIAIIFYCWRAYNNLSQARKQRVLRERVAYMLWCAADTADARQPVAVD
jgi:hypothetical protein